MSRSSKVILMAALVLLTVALIGSFMLWNRNPLHGVKVEGFAEVMLYERGDVALDRQVALAGDLQGLLRRWIDDDSGWMRSFVSFAPRTIVYIDDCSINFTGNRAVCNCRGKQLSRSMKAIDHELKELVMQSLATSDTG